MNVVIVDDDFKIRYVLKGVLNEYNRILKRQSVNIFSANNGFEGLGVIFTVDPDVVVIDTTLPQHSNKEIFEYVTSNPNFQNGKKLVLIVEEEQKLSNLGRNAGYQVLDKRSPKFLDDLIGLIDIKVKTELKAAITAKKNTTLWKLAKSTIAFANKANIIQHRLEELTVLSLKLPYFVRMLGIQLLLSLSMAFHYLLGGRTQDQNDSQDKEDKSYQNRRVYPALAVVGANVAFVVLQAGLLLGGGFFLTRGVQGATICPAALSSQPVTTEVTIQPTQSNEVFDCSGVDIVVESGAKIIFQRYVVTDSSTANDLGPTLLAKSLDIKSGGEVTADGQGYTFVDADSGTGSPANSTGQTGGSGGAHGGAGGAGIQADANVSPTPGIAYGNSSDPVTMGSAGGGISLIKPLTKTWTSSGEFNSGVFSSGIESPSTGDQIELTKDASGSDLESGLVAAWSFEESSYTGSPGDLVDSAGNNDGTSSGGVNKDGSGIEGSAANFDGTDDFFTIAHNTAVSLTGNLTISLWLKPNAAQDRYVLCKATGSTNSKYYCTYLYADGRFEASIFDADVNAQAAAIAPAGSIQSNQWNHVVYTYDGSVGKVYVDGVLKATSEVYVRTGSASANVDLTIGRRVGSSGFYAGSIDEVRLYDSALNDGEIDDLYNSSFYASGEQAWNSEVLDAGSGQVYQISKLQSTWSLDGSDNIAPKYQILGSATGAFSGEETVFPSGADSFYQDGGTYDLNSGQELDLSATVAGSFRYWKVRVLLETGSNRTDSPAIQDIRVVSFGPVQAAGGAGGGAIKLVVTNNLNVEGKISANGLDGIVFEQSSSGGGAGGSIWIEADSFTGNGTVEARGGSAPAGITYQGGGGGGGRVQMFCASANSFSGSASVSGGITSISQDGGTGSLLGPTCRPNAPTILKTYKSDATTIISQSEITSETTVKFGGDLSDIDATETLSLQIELRPIGESFTNVPTHSQVSGSPNPSSCENDLADCGNITVTNLARLTDYHWQARVRDSKGGLSTWVSYGNNAAGERDFRVSGNAANMELVSGNNQNGVVDTSLSEQLVVKVTDSQNQPVPGYSVSWTVLQGKNGGTLSGGNTITSSDGLSSKDYKLGKSTGSNIVRAAGSGLNGSPADFSLNGLPGNISYFEVTGPSYAIINQAFSPGITIRAFDAFNNLKTDYEGSPALTAVDSADGSTVVPGVLSQSSTDFAPSDNGIKEIVNLTFDTEDSIKVKVTDASATGISNAIAVVVTLGSCPDADGLIDASVSWSANTTNQGIFDCTNHAQVRITNNSTLTLNSYDSGDSNYNNDLGVILLANSVVVDSGSRISGDNAGYQSNRGPGVDWNYGSSHGGYGGSSAQPYGNVYTPTSLGSPSWTNRSWSCADFGSGGGAIKIETDSITLNGSITSNAAGCGKGSGGSIWIDTGTIAGSGSIAANGLSLGGGGRIAIYYSTDSSSILSTLGTTSPKVTAYTGATSYWVAGPGTIYVEQKGVDNSKQGSIFVRDIGQSAKTAALLAGDYTFKKITLTNYGYLTVIGQNSTLTVAEGTGLSGNGTASLYVQGIFRYTGSSTLDINGLTLSIQGDIDLVNGNNLSLGSSSTGGITLNANTWARNANVSPFVFGNINVGAYGTLGLNSYVTSDYDYTNDYGPTLISENITVASGGKISADNAGYADRGPGMNSTNGSGHGGYSNGGVLPYGDVYEPVALGSASYRVATWNCTEFGSGGGAMKIIANNLALNGTITSSATGCGRGSGGSIWLDVADLSGSGTIAANGYGYGGGGRIALYYTSDSSSILSTLGTVSPKITSQTGSATGGVAGPGTVYIENKGVDASRQGQLFVRGVGSGPNSAGLKEGSYTFKKVTLTNYGSLTIIGQNSSINLTEGTALAGNGTASLIPQGTINYTGSDALGINGLTLDIQGALNMSQTNDINIANVSMAGLTLRTNTWANPNGIYTFGDINIGSTGTLSLPSYDSGDYDYTNDKIVSVTVDNLIVASGGVISADLAGYGSSRGPGSSTGGGAYGGVTPGTSSVYGSVYEPSSLGSAGNGNPAGGVVKLEVLNTLINNGTISANGGSAWRSGASGGSVWIDTEEISGSGTIRANGGYGQQNYYGGSGGRIAVYYSVNNISSPFDLNSNIQSYGGTNEWGTGAYGGPGTIYIEQKGVDGPNAGLLRVDGANITGSYHAAIPEASYQFKQIKLLRSGGLRVLGQNSVLTVTSGAGLTGDTTSPSLTTSGLFNYTGTETLEINGVNVTIDGDMQGVDSAILGSSLQGALSLKANTWANTTGEYNFGNLTVGAYGSLYLNGYDNGDTNYTNDRGIVLNLQNLIINSGGVVSADVRGYGANRGPGTSGSGGAYGGTTLGRSDVYGSVYQPTHLGSAGSGNPAGGAMKLVISGSLNNNGTITSNGGSAWNSGASGGSIWIDTNEMSGIGIIRANGGYGQQNYIGGSGGRIAIYYTTNNPTSPFNFDNNIQSYGGTNEWGSGGGAYGGPGTIYIEQKGIDESNAGLLKVDGANITGSYQAAIPEDSYQFKQIKLLRTGGLKVLGQNSVLTVTSGAGLTGDSTNPSLITSGLFNYTGSDSLAINGVNVTINGNLQGVNDATLGSTLQGSLTLYANTWANTTGEYSFGNLQVSQYGRLNLVSYDNGDSDYSNDRGVTLNLDSLTVASGGVISGNGYGYSGTRGPGGSAGGGAHGGYTGGAAPYGDIKSPIALGSSGSGGSGGGAIKLNVANTAAIDGTLSSNGSSVSGCAGSGGSGGSIILTASTLTGNGYIQANGGYGGCNALGGSGGRIAIYYTTISGFNVVDQVESLGNSFEWNDKYYAGPGTIYVEDTQQYANGAGDLYISNKTGRTPSFNAMPFEPTDYTFNDVFIGPNVNIELKTDTATALGRGPVLNLTGDFTLSTGSLLNGKGKGFPSASGPGAGGNGQGQTGGAGGAHGGAGGNGESDGGNPPSVAGVFYGNQRQPLSLGSGGGQAGTGALGGNGGGAFAVRARSGLVTVAGTIDVSGNNGLTASPGGGGGAGGSLLLEAETCDITGTINAYGGNGGDDVFDGGGGGGGRVSVLYTGLNCDVSGTINVASGISSSAQPGQVGTYPGTYTIPQAPDIKNQYKTDAVTTIPVGGTTQEQTVKLQVSLSDPGATAGSPRLLQAQIAVAPAVEDFEGSVLGTSTYTSDAVEYTGGEPALALIDVPDLTPGESYKWQARVTNVSESINSEWTQFGDNSNSAADFTVSTVDDLRINLNKSVVNIGEPITATVRAVNDADNNDSTYRGTVAFSSTSGTANLPANYTFQESDNGERLFTDAITFLQAGTYTVTVSDTFAGSLTETSSVVTVRDPLSIANVTEDDIRVDSVNICWSGNADNIASIDYGTLSSGSYTGNTSQTSTYAADGCISINGLSASESYIYRINAQTEDGRTAVYEDSFATLGGLEITEATVDNITIDSARVCWNTNFEAIGSIKYSGAIPGDYSLQTDPTAEYKTEDSCLDLTSLSDDTGYVFRIEASTSDGREAIYEDSFTTLKIGLNITNVTLQSVNVNTVKVCWDSNLPSGGYINYGKGGLIDQVSETLETYGTANNCIDLTELETNVDYDFEIQATTADLRTDSYSGSFTTDEDLALEETQDCTANPVQVKCGLIIANLKENKIDDSSMQICWDTNFPSKGYIEYGISSYSKSTLPTSEYKNSGICQTIGGLNSEATYIYRINAQTEDGLSGSIEDSFSLSGNINTLLIQNVKLEVVSGSNAILCWKTNLPSISFVQYTDGQTKYESAKSSEYTTQEVCAQLNELNPEAEYSFTINASARNGKDATYKNSFSTKDKVDLAFGSADQCIKLGEDSLAINSSAIATLKYSSLKNSRCTVKYGVEELRFKSAQSSLGLEHISELDLNNFDGQRDVIYQVECEPDPAAEICQASGIIPANDFRQFLRPRSLIDESIASIAAASAYIILMASASIFSYPRLVLFGLYWFRLSRSRGKWGVVYDKKTKKPIPFARVVLLDRTNKILKDVITDLQGRYGFVVDSGSYKLQIIHGDYNPVALNCEVDIEKLVGLDIPLVRKDEKSRRGNVATFKESLKRNLVKVNNIIFATAFGFSLLALAISFSPVNLIIVLLFLLQLLIMAVLQSRRSWGSVMTSGGNLPLDGAVIRVYSVLEKRQVDVQISDEKGRFLINLEKGEYLIGAYKEGFEMEEGEQSDKFSAKSEKFVTYKKGSNSRPLTIHLRRGIN